MTRDPPEEKVNKELYICTGEREPPLLEVIIEIFTLFFFPHNKHIYDTDVGSFRTTCK